MTVNEYRKTPPDDTFKFPWLQYWDILQYIHHTADYQQTPATNSYLSISNTRTMCIYTEYEYVVWNEAYVGNGILQDMTRKPREPDVVVFTQLDMKLVGQRSTTLIHTDVRSSLVTAWSGLHWFKLVLATSLLLGNKVQLNKFIEKYSGIRCAWAETEDVFTHHADMAGISTSGIFFLVYFQVFPVPVW